MKRLIVFFCTCAVCLSALNINPADAASDYSTEIKTLSGLNIISGYQAENYKTRKSVSWNDYLNFILNMMSETKTQDNAVDKAKENGLISDGNINAAKSILYGEAVEVAVKALGFRKQLELYNGDYMRVASEKGLTKNAGGEKNSNLSSDQMLTLLYNMLEINIPELTFTAGGASYIKSEDTILSAYRNIKKSSGFVTANEFTGLYGADDGIYGYVAIDDISYEIKNPDFNDYLGMNVDFYYKDSGKSKEIVFIVPEKNKNSEIIIKADNIEHVEDDISAIEYLESEESLRLTRKRLDNTLKVIYNGKAYPEFTAENFRVKEGSLRLLDYNGNGVYDIAFITSYELLAVDKVNKNSMTIYNKYSSLKQIDLQEYDLNKNLFIYKGKNKAAFDEIALGDIIFIERSISGREKLLRLYISRETFSGKIEKYDETEKEITAEEKVYKINSDYLKYIQNGDAGAVKLKYGVKYKFYLDADGKIAAADYLNDLSEEFVLIYSIYMSEDEAAVAKYINADNQHCVCEFAEKVKVDGQSRLNSAKVYELLTGGMDNITPQLVRIKYDGANKIKSIDTAVLSADGSMDESEFTTAGKQELIYRSGSGPSSFQGRYYITTDTKIFASYDMTSHMPEDFAVVPNSRIFLKDSESKKYTVTPYNVDEYGFAEFILLEIQDDVKTLDILVQGISTILDNESEPRAQITGPVKNVLEVNVTAESREIFNGIKKGDYVRVNINRHGRATSVNTLYSPADGVKYSKYAENSFYNSAAIYYGTLKAIDYKKERMKMYFGNSSILDKSFNIKGLSITVYVYENGKVRNGTIMDLDIGDMMIVTSPYDKVSTIVVYK